MLQAFLQGARELIFPDNCLLCRQFLNSRHQQQLCIKCLAKFQDNSAVLSESSSPTPLGLDQSWSVCLYNETCQKLLHAFKYSSKTSLHKTFVPFMINFINKHNLPLRHFDLMAPIPLHPARWRERGYNQSALLSKALSKYYGIVHQESILTRQRYTQTQTELGAKQRWTNMEGAFRIKNSTEIKGKTIVLVDDLFTTGATLQSAAMALKKAGALRVCALTLSVAKV